MIRSKRLRESAKDAPHCMGCLQPNPNGDLLCLAHSNEIRHGRGASHKSHDLFGAILCQRCHDAVDGRSQELGTKDKKHERMRIAHDRTLLWWFESGVIQV